MSTEISRAKQHGAFSFDGATISYTTPGGSFSVSLSEIAVIGEFTTDGGPFGDDYFLVFVSRTRDCWYEASFYAKGRDELLDQLSAALGDRLQLGLANSANFASRIIWPPAFADRPLFSFTRVSASSFRGRLRTAIVPEMARTLSQDVVSVLGQNA